MEADRWAEMERELLEGSTRRIHEFERRLELEWEALRQLHEAPLKALPRRQRRIGAALIALALLLAATLTLVLALYFRLQSEVRQADLAARDAVARVSAEQASSLREVRTLAAEAQLAARGADRMVNVLSAADTLRFQLIGRRAAPAAAGQAFWSRSRGLVVNAALVPRIASGETLQAWLVTSRGPLGLGFLAPDAQGRVTAAFDTPFDLPGRVLGVLVTVEPAGGSAAPGNRVALTAVDP